MPELSVCRCCRKQVSNEARSCPHCGQPDPSDQWRRARTLLREGNKIEAIKVVREQTGWDLKKSKDFVENTLAS